MGSTAWVFAHLGLGVQLGLRAQPPRAHAGWQSRLANRPARVNAGTMGVSSVISCGPAVALSLVRH